MVEGLPKSSAAHLPLGDALTNMSSHSIRLPSPPSAGAVPFSGHPRCSKDLRIASPDGDQSTAPENVVVSNENTPSKNFPTKAATGGKVSWLA
jgi:hypothetical protein